MKTRIEFLLANVAPCLIAQEEFPRICVPQQVEIKTRLSFALEVFLYFGSLKCSQNWVLG